MKAEGGVSKQHSGLCRLSDGAPMLKGKKVTGFTNEEEKETGKEEVVPFLLQTELERKGAFFAASPNWSSNVQTDQRLITGQNAQSVEALAEMLVRALEQ